MLSLICTALVCMLCIGSLCHQAIVMINIQLHFYLDCPVENQLIRMMVRECKWVLKILTKRFVLFYYCQCFVPDVTLDHWFTSMVTAQVSCCKPIQVYENWKNEGGRVSAISSFLVRSLKFVCSVLGHQMKLLFSFVLVCNLQLSVTAYYKVLWFIYKISCRIKY